MLSSHSKGCHVTHPHGARTERGAVISLCQRGAPPSAAHLLPGKRHRGHCHEPEARCPPAGLDALPALQSCPAPPGSGSAERIDLHIPTFVPRPWPIRVRGEAGRRGGACARLSRCRRRLQSGWEPLRARHCNPEPQPRAQPPPQAQEARIQRLPARPRRGRLDSQAPASPRATMVCGGFSCSKNCLCALNLLYTVSRRRPVAPARAPSLLPARLAA